MGNLKGNFKGHIYPLCLNRKLYLATIRLQADKRLGKAYSALLPFVTGLNAMGYLSDEDFELYKEKYSVGLDVEQLSPTQIKQRETERNRNRQLNRHFGEILKQWPTLKESAKQYHLEEAAKYKNLKNARLVLDLANGETVSPQVLEKENSP
jgi:hypothetical protein